MPIAPSENGKIAKTNATQIHYELSGPDNAPVLILSHSLGSDLTMWDDQFAHFTKTFRVLRYDTRGHGRSEISSGPYDFDKLGRDVLALVDALSIAKFSFCGLSMGGAIGMWLGINASYRLQKLALCSTAAKLGTADAWNARIETVRKRGTKSIAAATMERWFTPQFRERQPQAIARVRGIFENTSPDGYIACCEALREGDLRELVKTIRTPALVLSATHDPATPPADGKFVAQQIPGARYVELDAAHLCNIEQANQFTQEVSGFLQKE